MAETSAIEWTDATWNPVTGCSVVSPGCTNCYAMRLAGGRLKHHPSRAGLTQDSKAGPVWTGDVRLNEGMLGDPLRWRRPRRIFVCAHGDLFHESVPDEWIDRVFAVMALCPQHTFQVLTKRSGRMRSYMARVDVAKRIGALMDELSDEETEGWFAPCSDGASAWIEAVMPLPNVWLGVSVEDQRRADERIPGLLATPAAVRFVSAEPLLGPIRLDHFQPDDARTSDGRWINALAGEVWHPGNCGESSVTVRGKPKLDWVIVGGESGAGARPMHPDWARGLRDQCASSETPFFFKQWGAWGPDAAYEIATEKDARYGDWHGAEFVRSCMCSEGRESMFLVGKKAAGRALDGVTHDGMPGAAGIWKAESAPHLAAPGGQPVTMRCGSATGKSFAPIDPVAAERLQES